MTILPLFGSHYSLSAQGGILTLQESGKAKPGAALSVFDCAKQAGLKDVVVIDDRIDGLVQGFKVAQKEKVKLCFGIKMVVCADAEDKSDASLSTESKIVVFCRNGEANAEGIPKGYSKLVSIWNRASIKGHYYQCRTSWQWLKEQWSDDLMLGLPFFSSFLARNTLSFNRVVPDLPAQPWVFREVESELPFARLIDSAIDRYAKDNPCQVVPSKTIYYAKKADFLPYQVLRCIGNRSSWDSPSIDHLGSDAFSFEDYLALCPPPTLHNPVSL